MSATPPKARRHARTLRVPWSSTRIGSVVLTVAFALSLPSGSQGTKPASSLMLGAAWYPEQWPEERWVADLDLMEKAHMNVVRIGEFAWSTEEPSEGNFNLEWMKRAVRLAEKHHILVVIGTPTDAPPAWLTTDHPETLRVDANGKRAEHGARRQFNYANSVYRKYCADIAGRLAKEFGHDPDVIGWQIGNEITDESFDPQTRQQFQHWLERRFRTLNALNTAWTTAYWSQTYGRWSEIPLPSGGGNPGLLLEHKHFVSDIWRDFIRVQIDAIRRYATPRQFVTTNIGGLGWSDNFDHYEVTHDLDLASWDDYVGEGHLNATRNGFMHDFVRGWKRVNFWVMETQPGSVNWAPVNSVLDRGETRAMAWQAVGHGADAVLYWQWRSALNGQEQYHGALVGPDGEPLPLYDEVAEIGDEFEKASTVLAGTSPVSQVALLHSYDSRWAIDFQPHNHNYDQLAVLLSYYRPLRDQRLSVDVVNASDDLSPYRLVMAPSLNLVSPDLARKLLDYVEEGGHLLLGPRSGMKDENDALNLQRQPGPLADALGARVEQYFALDSPVPVSGDFGPGTVTEWAEQLSVREGNAQVLMRYGKSNGWLDDQPAMISRTFGKGRITYLGGLVDPDEMGRVVNWALGLVHLSPEFEALPDSVEVCRRVGNGRGLFILINHSGKPATLRIPSGMRLVMGSEDHGSEVLPPQGVSILEATSRTY